MAIIEAEQVAIAHSASVGRPMPVVELKIVTAETRGGAIAGSEGLSKGEVGENCVNGPLLMAGYWGRPEAAAEVLQND